MNFVKFFDKNYFFRNRTILTLKETGSRYRNSPQGRLPFNFRQPAHNVLVGILHDVRSQEQSPSKSTAVIQSYA